MKNITIQAFKLSLSKADIINMLPAKIVEKIKAKGINPYFQAYSVIHEGVSQPKDLDRGGEYVKISWPRAAIQSVRGLINRGLQFFVDHGFCNRLFSKKKQNSGQ